MCIQDDRNRSATTDDSEVPSVAPVETVNASSHKSDLTAPDKSKSHVQCFTAIDNSQCLTQNGKSQDSDRYDYVDSLNSRIVWKNVILFTVLHIIHVYSLYLLIATKAYKTWIFRKSNRVVCSSCFPRFFASISLHLLITFFYN